MDPEKQQLLRTPEPEVVQINHNHVSIAYPSSLEGKVPPDRFYHTMERLNHTYGPPSRWTKIFVLVLFLLFVGILMPFAMLRWFTPRHFPVKVWIPIDCILAAITIGLAVLLYIRSRRIRGELSKIVKKENKKCYHRTGIHLRFEPGGVATRPSIVIERMNPDPTASNRAPNYGSHQAHHAPPGHRFDPSSQAAPAGRAPAVDGSRLPSPPPFRQQHSFYEVQQQPNGPSQHQHGHQPIPAHHPQQQPQLHQLGPSPISPRYQQQQPLVQRQPSPPMSPRHQQQHQLPGPPPPSNYAPHSPPPSGPRAHEGYGNTGAPFAGQHVAEFTAVPMRDAPSQQQHYDIGEASYSPTPQKRAMAGGSQQFPPRQPPQQPFYPPQQQGRQGAPPPGPYPPARRPW